MSVNSCALTSLQSINVQFQAFSLCLEKNSTFTSMLWPYHLACYSKFTTNFLFLSTYIYFSLRRDVYRAKVLKQQITKFLIILQHLFMFLNIYIYFNNVFKELPRPTNLFFLYFLLSVFLPPSFPSFSFLLLKNTSRETNPLMSVVEDWRMVGYFIFPSGLWVTEFICFF